MRFDNNEDISFDPSLWSGYLDLGPPTKKYGRCSATMWNEESNNKSCPRKEPTFSLCCRNSRSPSISNKTLGFTFACSILQVLVVRLIIKLTEAVGHVNYE